MFLLSFACFGRRSSFGFLSKAERPPRTRATPWRAFCRGSRIGLAFPPRPRCTWSESLLIFLSISCLADLHIAPSARRDRVRAFRSALDMQFLLRLPMNLSARISAKAEDRSFPTCCWIVRVLFWVFLARLSLHILFWKAQREKKETKFQKMLDKGVFLVL